MADDRIVTRQDIEEIKADGKATREMIQSLLNTFTIHDTAQKALEVTVRKLDNTIFGDGTENNPGHVAITNLRLKEIERIQSSYTKAVWAIVTPLLGLLGVGIIYLLVLALTK